MGLKDYDYPDDYEDPFDTLDGWRRRKILETERFESVRWGIHTRLAWYVAMLASFVWACILCSLGLFCLITIVLIPVAFPLFVLGAYPLQALIYMNIRNKTRATLAKSSTAT